MNVPLASDGETLFRVTYQNGAKSEVRTLRWLPVNVLHGGNFTLRKGDSLVLIARPEGNPSDDKGTMQFTVGVKEYPVRKAAFQMPVRFDDPGIITVTGTYTSTSGVSQTGTIMVKVVEHQFIENPACWAGEYRSWDLPLPAGVILEADARLFVETIALLPGGGLQLGLIANQNEPRYFLSRLGTSGPILDLGMANGFNFWRGRDTYTRVVETLPDGSDLVELMLILSPVLPEVTVRVDLIIGGVVFEDGTITRTLTQADFDAQGTCRLRFIRPETAKNSVCHSLRLFQGEAQIGYVQ